MSSLKEFIESNSKDQTNKLIPIQDTTAKIIDTLATSTLDFPRTELEKFSENAIRLANSDKVLTELSQVVGEPKEAESEDEFVKRAKSSLGKILKQKISIDLGI